MFDFDDTTAYERYYEQDLALRDRTYTIELKIDEVPEETLNRQRAVYAQLTEQLR